MHVARVRRLLVLKPELTIMDLCAQMTISKDYAAQLLKKVRKEKIHRYQNYTINKILANIEDVLNESDKHLWSIVNSATASNKDRIAALREIRNNNKELFEKMFDSGIFERQLGKLKTEGKMDHEQHKELLIAFDNAFGTNKSKRDNA